MPTPKQIYRQVEALINRVVAGSGTRRLAEQLPPALLEAFGPVLDVRGVQVFEQRPDGLSLRGAAGACSETSVARVDLALRPEPSPAELPAVVDSLGLIGADGLVVALWFADAEAAEASVRMHWLSVLQNSLSERLQRRALEDQVEQARVIQTSLLPSSPPLFDDFEIAALSLPAHVVGGDAHDFIALDEDTLAIAIADVSGHGLPAALQARDVVVGIRMGVERDLKITRMIEKLNRVIHASGLSSRFVSLVFGELERNGNFTYINAGHPPPLLLDDRGLHELAIGGIVLGPDVTARYKLGFAHLDRGAAMLLYSDGVLEHGAARREMFGVQRLAQWLGEWRGGPVEAAVADLVTRLRAHGEGAAFEDDVTVVLVRRPHAHD